MRQRWSQSAGDVETIDVILVEDEPTDEFLALLHELALEAIALRATSPGDPRPEPAPDETPDPTAADTRATPWLPRRLGRRRIAQLAVITVAALAVAVGSGVVDARRAAARLAVLVATPSVLAAVTEPPVELWRVPGRLLSADADVLLVAGAQDGSLQRVDPATGEVVWTFASGPDEAPTAGHCVTVGDAEHPDPAPGEVGTGPDGLVTCVAYGTAGQVLGVDGSPRSRVVVVAETGQGAVADTFTVEGDLLVVEAMGEDLLVAGLLADGTLSAARWRLDPRMPRWEYTSPQPVLTGAMGPEIDLGTDALGVGDVTLDLASGEALDAEEALRASNSPQEYALPGGATATWAWHPDGESGLGAVTTPDGGWGFGLWGPPLVPEITDGSQAGTLVVLTADGDRILGRDLRTGRSRWSLPYEGALPVRATALVDDVMLLDDGATVTAIDVRTGGGLWRAQIASDVTQGSALIDGEVVLLPVRDGASAVELAAVAIADGTLLWRTGTPAGTVSLAVVHHHLVASTGDAVVGLG